ncbi:mannose-6-phosphate isomerase, class I [Humidisolicoccus flavus]|uniref:mannose-6-phosphate isomerase, class I n=1 Tax=Humidisolicoccus flavus TaxID=3111414 RepID=UPI003246B9C9
MQKLSGIARDYPWGSESAIQEFIGQPAGSPLAEIWFGAHPSAPAVLEDGTPLDEAIESDPTATLGPSVSAQFGELPFLVKFLAPGTPVSLQVHPTPENAISGFADDEANEIPIDAPHRSFKDRSHKPEMIFALTEFSGLVGFRSIEQCQRLLGTLSSTALNATRAALSTTDAEAGLRDALASIIRLTPAQVDEVVLECGLAANNHGAEIAEALITVTELAEHFPSDVGAVASLLLRRLNLAPGESIFVPSGMPHAYLSGLTVEIMANSDNVLRAGLTGKHINVPALLANTSFAAASNAPTKPDQTAPVQVLSPGAAEFELVIVRPRGSRIELGDHDGPTLALCIEPEATLQAGEQSLLLQRGEAAFVFAQDGAISVSGAGALCLARTPEARS